MSQTHSQRNSPDTTAIGRYRIAARLGAGSQGVVYRAVDPDIDREVAIKTLTGVAAGNTALQSEARKVGRLKHPHIAAVYDTGVCGDTPYVVYELVQGESLKSVVARGAIPVAQTVRWLTQILDAIDYAHTEGIVHRDLNPNNIMIDAAGGAKVLDFGIALPAGTLISPGDAIMGTVNYMAPEQLAAGVMGPATDVFALGLICFEMLTGQRAVDVDDAMAAMYRIAHDELPAPSAIDPGIDHRFDVFYMRAVAKDPAERYLSARAMNEALKSCACDEDSMPVPAQESATGPSKSTLAFLLRRMRRKSDFPAMSERITEINQQTTALEQASVSELANTILKDYALTTKLLKLVNSSFYGQYGGDISTVSRAVVILGLKQVRMVAQSLLLFEHLDDKPHADKLKEVASQSVLSGIIGRQLADRIALQDGEEAFVCAMVHDLGRYLTLFYLPEEYSDIRAAMEHRGLGERAACLDVLGLDFAELGAGIAREWGFPEAIVSTIQPALEAAADSETDAEAQLRAVTRFSAELCRMLTQVPVDSRRMQDLCQRFQKSFELDADQITDLIKSALNDARDFGPLITQGLETTQVFRAVDAWSRGETPQDDAVIEPVPTVAGGDVEQQTGSVLVINGIQDITNALIEDCSLNDILSMILETVYRGLGVTRVLLCITDHRQRKLIARLGLGKDVDLFLRKFAIPVGEGGDLFSAAVDKQVDLKFPDELSSSSLPAWYCKLAAPRAMALLPVVVNQVCLGAVYCDTDASGGLSVTDYNYLNTLRNQAALALKQTHSRR